MANFVIIGLSTFGEVLARELYSLGEEVLAMDVNKEKVQEIKDSVTQAVVGDATDKKILEKLLTETEATVIVSLGDNFEEYVMVIYYLKELGIPRIIAKASTLDRERVLRMVGATEVIHPERDMAISMAERLKNPNLLKSVPMDENWSIVEFEVPKKFEGKSIAELKLLEKHKVNLLAIKQTENQKLFTNPPLKYVLKPADILIVLGDKQTIHSLSTEES